MTTKIKHMAIISDTATHLGTFYERLFKMTGVTPTGRAVTVSDGYVGLNINPQSNGRKAGLNHWGFEVDDAEEISARLRERYPQVEVVRRPSNRPFAGLSTHDPEGNIFDLSQKGMENRRSIYAVEEERHNPRHISHFMVPAMDAAALATFYKEIYDLKELPKRSADDPHFYLSDGVVTLMIGQWRMSDYGVGNLDGKPSIDHIGFRVESMDAFLSDLDRLVESDPSMAPQVFRGEDQETRRQYLARCALGKLQLADPEHVLLDITDS